MAANLETFPYEEVLLQSGLFFVLKGSENFQIFPVNGSVCAFGCMASKTRDIRRRVTPVSGDVITMLFLPCSDLDARLANVLRLRRA